MVEVVIVPQSAVVTLSGTTTVQNFIPNGTWLVEKITAFVNGIDQEGLMSIKHGRVGKTNSYVAYVPIFPAKPYVELDPMNTVVGGDYIETILEDAPASGPTTLAVAVWLRSVD